MTEITPWNISRQVDTGELAIHYGKITEVCQGGPEIGTLWINGKMPFHSDMFGGPMIIQENKAVFLPRFDRRRRQFELCRIDLDTLRISILTPPRNLIWLDKLEDDILYFYEDLNREALSHFDLAAGELHTAKKNAKDEMRYYPLFAPFLVIIAVFVAAFSILSLLCALGIKSVSKLSRKLCLKGEK